ncbi:hypothetical protein KJ068_14545 [bacterium]|nr:hypothetical protein [bacterium]
MSAKKVMVSKQEALRLAKQVDEIYATKGRQVIHVNLKKDKPDEDTLTNLLIGRTGNLRAPVIRKGRTLIVGFDEATYKRLFEGK